MNTLIRWLYRDGSNYKAASTAVLRGTLTEAEKKSLKSCLEENEWLIPSQVGLEDLQHRLTGFPDRDDHVWHELLDLSDTDVDPDAELPTVKQFLKNMLKSKGRWKVSETAKLYGIK